MKLAASLKFTLAFGLGLDKDGVQIDATRKDIALGILREQALKLLGGYQLHFAEGGWRSDTGYDFQETCLVLTTTQPVGFDEEQILAVARAGKEALNQECVYRDCVEVKSGFLS